MAIITPAPIPSNPNSVRALFTFDGGVGNDEPIDHSLFNQPWSFISTPVPSAVSWFGCPNALFMDRLGVSPHPTFVLDNILGTTFGNQNWALEIFFRQNNSQSNSVMAGVGVSPNIQWLYGWSLTGNGMLRVSADGSTITNSPQWSMNNSAGVWNFSHIQYYNGAFTVWVGSPLGANPAAPLNDPALRRLDQWAPGFNLHQPSTPMFLGTYGGSTVTFNAVDSNLDIFRLTIGEVYYPPVLGVTPASIPIPAGDACSQPFPIPVSSPGFRGILRADPAIKVPSPRMPIPPVLS